MGMGVGLDPPDERLVLLAKDGSLDAFNRLVERHQSAVYSLCFRILGQSQSAEDATQEAFLSAYRSLDRFEGGNFRSWLLRIAANESKDELRRRRRKDQAASLSAIFDRNDLPVEVPDPHEGALDIIERHEFGAELEQLLLEIPFEQRQAVLLVDVYDFQYEEVARLTGTSVGTIKSRIHRGRERLRNLVLQRPELSGAIRRLVRVREE
ncbi:MAG: sigma-70 family RNA polymerase sigma factor [Dehalococcoidia bacterium]|nr:sigma-70 family RNA polymerase sigma factor [Dehalococcoidia bacterium]